MNDIPEKRHYRYFDFVMAAFVCVLMASNVIGAGKRCQLWGFTFSAGVLFFPISYVFGDILTEVYGYARARRVVWAGFSAPDWPHQATYETVFGGTPRVALASLVAYFCGEFCNSYVLAKMKIFTEGKHLWARTIGSTIVGEGVDSIIFYPLAFWGASGWTTEQMIAVLSGNYALKVAWEALMTPFTYKIVNFLKRVESEDYYDRKTQFTPFSLET